MDDLFDSALHTLAQAQEHERIVRFMRLVYHHYILVADGIRAENQGTPQPPSGISAELVDDCISAARMLAHAVRNHYAVSWDGDRYADHISKTGTSINVSAEDLLAATFPPLPSAAGVEPKPEQYGIIAQPAVITDCHGNILVWSLPRIISEQRQATILAATRHIEKRLRIGDDEHIEKDGQMWRTSSRFFTPGIAWKSGACTFSPAWLALGRKTDNDRLYGTRVLKESDGIAWMAAWNETGGLLDGILSIAHPALYRAAADVQLKLSASAPDLREQIARWPCVFNCAQLIINRMTLHHRDTSGRPGWFDALLSLGTYGETAVMQFRNLGAAVPYDTGSLVLVASRVVIHAVPQVPPDRICYAFFMVDSVHHRMRVPDPRWSKRYDRLKPVFNE